MKVNRHSFETPGYVLSEDLDLSSVPFDQNHIKRVESCHIELTGNNYDSLCVINIEIKAKVIAPSAYSGKDVVLNLDFADIIQISDEDEDDEELFYEKDMIFEIDPYVISLIVGEVPMVVTLKDEKLPEDGKGYRILTEDEYLEEQKSKTDPRWSKLDDIDLD